MIMSASVQHQRRLMRAVASGDTVAFSTLYDILGVATYTVFRRHLPTVADADTAMKLMWLYVWQNAQSMNCRPGSPEQAILATAEDQAQSLAGFAR